MAEAASPERQLEDGHIRLCLAILRKTPEEITEQFRNYEETKNARSEQPLAFRQFVFFSTIRASPRFVFAKTKLAFSLMAQRGLADEASFLAYAPVLELASELDAAPLFRALTGESKALGEAAFTSYVQALRDAQGNEASSSNKNDGIGPMVGEASGIADTSHMPPKVGKIAVCTKGVVFVPSVFGRRKVIRFQNVEAITLKSGVLRTTLNITLKPPAATKVSWDSAAFFRPALHRCLLDLLAAQRLADGLNDKQLAQELVREVAGTCRRMLALKGIKGSEPLKMSPFRPKAGEEQEQAEQRYLAALRASMQRHDEIRDSKLGFLGKILPGLAPEKHKDEHLGKDIDPELRLRAKHKDEEEELDFSVKQFGAEVKHFKHQLWVFKLVHSTFHSLKEWDHPVASALCVVWLLYMCWKDWLGYLPALAALCNAGLLLLLRAHPHLLDNPQQDGEDEEVDEDNVIQRIRKTIDGAKSGVQGMQNALRSANKAGDKVQGMYTWRVPAITGKFLGISVAAAVALFIVPFRMLLPFVVADVFTSKWRGPGTLSRMLKAIPVSEKVAHPHTE